MRGGGNTLSDDEVVGRSVACSWYATGFVSSSTRFDGKGSAGSSVDIGATSAVQVA